MRNPTTSLFPVLAVLFALGELGMPEGVAAQDGCTTCVYVEPDGGPRRAECEPKPKGKGYEWCENFVKWNDCQMSSDEEDCGLDIALTGRAVDAGSAVAIAAVGGVEIPRWRQLIVPTAATPPAVARQACTGAIVHRRYSPASIVELRAGLRHVTI